MSSEGLAKYVLCVVQIVDLFMSRFLEARSFYVFWSSEKVSNISQMPDFS